MDLGGLLQLNTEQRETEFGHVLILSFAGKITSDNIFELNDRIKNVFQAGIYNVILDLSTLEYINSTGIALLLSIAKTVEQNNGKLALVNPSEFVKELLEMTDLTNRFDLAESVEKAIEGFSGGK